VTAGGKQVAGRLRPAPGGRGCRHPGRGARGVHPPSACCGCRGWVPPQWTSNRRRWPGSLLRRLSRCPGRHVLWTSSCLHDRALQWPHSVVQTRAHSPVLDCRCMRSNTTSERLADQDQWIHESMGGWAATRGSFRRTAAKRPAHQSCEGSFFPRGSAKLPEHHSARPRTPGLRLADLGLAITRETYGVLPQQEIAGLRQPSMAPVLASVVGQSSPTIAPLSKR
jgi:hypothetical protein